MCLSLVSKIGVKSGLNLVFFGFIFTVWILFGEIFCFLCIGLCYLFNVVGCGGKGGIF